MDFRTLPQDCQCVTHNGPHWLDMDRMQFDLNLHIIERTLNVLTWHAFCEAEVIRLREKVRNMEHYATEIEPNIFPDGYSEHDYNRRLRAVIEEKSCGR